MRTVSDRLPRRGAERMLIVRVALALGLALLLVIGAWSASCRTTDAHTAMCLAPGVSASSATPNPDSARGTASPLEAPPIDVGVVVIASLCCFVLVLLLRRLPGGAPLLRTGTVRPSVFPPRTGPRRTVPALSLAQLSLSRT